MAKGQLRLPFLFVEQTKRIVYTSDSRTDNVMEQKKHEFAHLARLPLAVDEDSAYQRLATRARQILAYDWVWMTDLDEHPTFWESSFSNNGVPFSGIIMKPLHGGWAHLFDFMEARPNAKFLDVDRVIPAHPQLVTPQSWRSRTIYDIIERDYGDTRAARSEVLKMNHIDEGTVIIGRAAKLMYDYTGCDVDRAIAAFQLHPLLQDDYNLVENYKLVGSIDTKTVLLAMEYRSVANEHLSHVDPNAPIRLSPISEVNLMLVGDKVQNFKDFKTYHKGTHERSTNLEAYFTRWLDRLGINDGLYVKLVKNIPDF